MPVRLQLRLRHTGDPSMLDNFSIERAKVALTIKQVKASQSKGDGKSARALVANKQTLRDRLNIALATCFAANTNLEVLDIDSVDLRDYTCLAQVRLHRVCTQRDLNHHCWRALLLNSCALVPMLVYSHSPRASN